MTKKTGVILLNMGGPEKLEDVTPFLLNLFSDRDIIRLGPRIFQKIIARFIVKKRAPKSIETYKKIGGGSPLIRLTKEQTEALETSLKQHGDFRVVPAMRYWGPSAQDALTIFAKEKIKDIIALPLYPHFSKATSGSSLKDLRKALKQAETKFQLSEILSWPTEVCYIEAFAKKILKGLQEFQDDNVEILYSAHSLPVSFIQEGDPYLDHLKSSIKEIEKITHKRGRLCFQSRSGPVEWLSPSTSDMLKTLKEEGCKNILMVPLSFVSDHIETLYEINILYRNMAKQMGMECKPCESLNSDPVFIQALTDLVLSRVKR